ncbi:MAG: nucleotide-binding universal stress UspA family protein [Acidimicrobiales bacterium]|jgi:nucleotide-binding universal stress UspA family protein
MQRIVVAIDSSPNSTAAAVFAAELGKATGTPIVAVHVMGLLDRLRAESDPVVTQTHREEIAAEFRSTWCEPLTASNIDFQLVDGSPVQALLRFADKPGDVIVMGSRGAGGFADLLLGSTSTQVAQHSKVPVVIVPSGHATVT